MSGIVNAVFGGSSSAPPPPDYTPVANASKEVAELGDKLARDQMAQAKEQYDQNMAVAKPVVDAQLKVMQQGLDQGQDYYEYGKTFRPLEQQMGEEAAKGTAEADAAERAKIEGQALANATNLQNKAEGFERTAAGDAADVRNRGNAFETNLNAAGDALGADASAYQAEAGRDIALYTGGNSGIVDKYGADIDNDVNTAVADSRAGQAQATNQAIRQALRYGLSVPSSVAGLTTDQAQQIAGAANNTRTSSINNYRNLVGQGIGMKRDAFSTSASAKTSALTAKQNAFTAGNSSRLAAMDADKMAFDVGQTGRMDAANRSDAALNATRNFRIQDKSLDWGKKLDVTGLVRGMPGASQGAYSTATNAGSAAVGNQMAPGQALSSSTSSANGTALNGRTIAMSGLNGVLNSQTSYVNNATNNATTQRGQNMDVAGSVAGMFMPSDARLKMNIVKLRDDKRGFGWYQFDYLWGGKRHTGVMAQEVAKVIPHAVKRIGDFLAVDYSALQGARA